VREGGLVKVGVVALDGTKIAAAASERATRSYEQIAKEILEEAARIDAASERPGSALEAADHSRWRQTPGSCCVTTA
jgi:hypothetical protein